MTTVNNNSDDVSVESIEESHVFEDFVDFRRMITPQIIKIVFWMAFVASLLAGFGLIIKDNWFGTYYDGQSRYFGATLLIIVFPFLLRIVCEVAILFFRINETLTEIKNMTR